MLEIEQEPGRGADGDGEPHHHPPTKRAPIGESRGVVCLLQRELWLWLLLLALWLLLRLSSYYSCLWYGCLRVFRRLQ